jgi:predicted transposase YbfD/YdcC
LARPPTRSSAIAGGCGPSPPGLANSGCAPPPITEFAPLLDQIPDRDLANRVITADALHAQRAHAVYLIEQRHAHYLFTVKDNQPTLAAQLCGLPWKQIPALHRTTHRGHGRGETREIQVLTVDDLLFPHARQVARIRRKRRRLGTRRWTTETVYTITDLPPTRPTPKRSPPGPASTGPSKTPRTTCVTSPSPKTRTAPEPATLPP